MNRICIIKMLLLALVMVSCHSDDVQERLNDIKAVGDKEPKQAMKMLDAIRPQVVSTSEHTKMKCLMLDMRLRDKADMMPTSDDSARLVASYFDSHGTANERLLAHYLLARTYTDMGEAPRALDEYHHAAECADTTAQDCDFLQLAKVHG